MNIKIKPTTFVWWLAAFVAVDSLRRQVQSDDGALGWGLWAVPTAVMVGSFAYVSYRRISARRARR